MKIARRLRLGPVNPVSGLPTLAWWLGIGLVAVALFAVSVPLNTSIYGVHVAIAFALGIIQCGSLLTAPVRPGLAIALFIVSVVLLSVTSTDAGESRWPWPWSVTSIIVFSALLAILTFYITWQHGLWAYLLSIGATIGAITWQRLSTERLDMAMANIIIAASIGGAVYVLVVLFAQRQRIREELLQERQLTAGEQSRRMLIEERQRIARELHDVVAHSMSIIQVQATTARYRLPELDASAANEFDEIGATAREAMTEMRRLLGVLRNGEDDPELSPQQGINEIENLVATASRAGIDVSFTKHPVPDVAPPSVHVAAFRIAQEAMSNAARHAPGAPIHVTVDSDGKFVIVDIVNAPSDDPPGSASRGSGHGLIGMRERTTLLGGSLSTGPTADGGYSVHAELPLHPHTEEIS